MAAPSTLQKPTIQIAFLRGINVGGRHRLPMRNLVSIFEAEAAEIPRMRTDIMQSISRRFGWETPVTTRTAQELSGIVRANPFLRGGARSGHFTSASWRAYPIMRGSLIWTPGAHRVTSLLSKAVRSTSTIPTALHARS